MSCIADFIIRSPDLPLAAAIERAPAMRLEVEQAIATDPERPVLFLWACGGDFDTFEAAMESDETVTDPELMESLSDRRLYRVQVSEDAEVVI
ncbi:bacterio-opsin activator domain-containing protein [Halorubrum sp. Atlit-9R]|nr:bacterio-opsin activator domain-containing protein [Halorubrum sp. Atlit-9R]